MKETVQAEVNDLSNSIVRQLCDVLYRRSLSPPRSPGKPDSPELGSPIDLPGTEHGTGGSSLVQTQNGANIVPLPSPPLAAYGGPPLVDLGQSGNYTARFSQVNPTFNNVDLLFTTLFDGPM